MSVGIFVNFIIKTIKRVKTYRKESLKDKSKHFRNFTARKFIACGENGNYKAAICQLSTEKKIILPFFLRQSEAEIFDPVLEYI